MRTKFKFKGMLFAAVAGVAAAGCTPASDVGVMSSGLASSPEVGGPAVMSRLTEGQYRNVIKDIFGSTVSLGGRFEPDNRVDHLIRIGAGQASITAGGLEQYDAMARSLGQQIVAEENRMQYIPCTPASATQPDAACTRQVLARVGELLFRRPLTESELQEFTQASAEATQKVGDYYHGLSLGLAGLLASPQFLFRHEVSEPDPNNPGQLRLDAYSKATRLSFLLWNTSPDPALLAAAAKGELHTPAGLQRQVDRMIASPRLEEGVRAFFRDMLEFERFNTLAKDTTIYPKFTFAAARDAQEQTMKTLVHHLVTNEGDYRKLFTTRETFLTPLLGSLYRTPVVAPDGLPDAWVPYVFDDTSKQSGILTHASFLSMHSHPGRSSPTMRGMALREVLMCQRVPLPPGDVDFSDFDDPDHSAPTIRERLAAHSVEPMCAGCHRITDPMGLALENFDTVAGFRTTENRVPIDTSGELDGVKFDGPDGLGRALHDNPAIPSCLVNRLYAYSVGRNPTRSESDWLKNVVEPQFAADGYKVLELLRRIAASETYYRVIPTGASSDMASALVN